jgi:glycosyltransferase involved in cell wall biosynthesis
MKIAQIAPLSLDVPPRLYGGTERVVSYLTEALVQMGHEVTLFATAKSSSSARLVACCAEALWLDPDIRNGLPYYMMMLELLRQQTAQFDVMHFHIEQLHFPVFSSCPEKTLTTLHARQDVREFQKLYGAFPQMPLVAISRSQRQQVQKGKVLGIVPHGIPLNLHAPNYSPTGGYLAFVGRISPEKGLDRAITIAREADMPLKIAGIVYPSDEQYFRESIKPLLGGTGVEFVGEIDDRTKTTFLGEAAALLFPVDWPEPFGLVMIEAMSCGTPVIAFNNGAIPEIIESGISGYVVSDLEEAVRRVPEALRLDRSKVRRQFEERFSAERMAANYVAIYGKLALSRSRSAQARNRLSSE